MCSRLAWTAMCASLALVLASCHVNIRGQLDPDALDDGSDPSLDLTMDTDGGEIVCGEGETLCDGECVDTSEDPMNCGACDNECGADEICLWGECVPDCADPLYPCGDDCVDLTSDASNCGACGVQCDLPHTTGSCVDGVCVVTGCEDGWYDIDGDPYNGCEYECTATLSAESTDDGSCTDGLDNDCDGRTDDEDPDCGPCVPEFCNELDDDCDMLVDEDFDLRTDP
ncbi:MAG: hypothetical protein JRG91_19910, partial [Deltaproteobacteria bacterium]|nr:hypothetical protein [Deltaproteobacteria bacterium]